MKFLAERHFPERVQAPRFSPDGLYLAVKQSSLYFPTTAKVCLLGGASFTELVATVDTGCGWFPPVCFHPTERVFVTGGGRDGVMPRQPKALRVWSYPDGVLQDSPLSSYTDISAPTFTPDGECLIIGHADYMVLSWSSGQVLNRFLGEEMVKGIDVHPNGTTLLMTGSDTLIAIVEIDAQIAPPEKDDVVLNEDGAVMSSDLAWGEFEYKWEKHVFAVKCENASGAIFSPDGRFIAISHWNPVLYSYPEREVFCAFDAAGRRIATPKDKYSIPPEEMWSNPVFTPDARTLLCGSPDGNIFRWDVQSGELLAKVEAHAGQVVDIAFSPDGTTLASCGADKTLKLWQLDS